MAAPGVGVAVAVNVANETNTAYIGNNTTINSSGLTVTAGMAQRPFGDRDQGAAGGQPQHGGRR